MSIPINKIEPLPVTLDATADDAAALATDVLAAGMGRGAGAITARLRRAIETGVFADGEQLPPERQLATAFGTARSTIRKALNQLEKKGLVTRRVGSGTFVNYSGPLQTATADVADLTSPLQLIEARFAVEPYMARLAAIHASARDLASMEAVLTRLESCGGDKDVFTRWDSEFHVLLARCSRNPLLLQVYQTINSVRAHAQWNAMKEQILMPEQIEAYNVQHRAIYEALCQRDAQKVAALIDAHLEKARRDLIGAKSA